MAIVDADRTARLDAATPTAGRASACTRRCGSSSSRSPSACARRAARSYLRIVQHLVDEPSAAPGPPTRGGDEPEPSPRQPAPRTCDTPPFLAACGPSDDHQTTSFLLRALADRAAELDGARDPTSGARPRPVRGQPDRRARRGAHDTAVDPRRQNRPDAARRLRPLRLGRRGGRDSLRSRGATVGASSWSSPGSTPAPVHYDADRARRRGADGTDRRGASVDGDVRRRHSTTSSDPASRPSRCAPVAGRLPRPISRRSAARRTSARADAVMYRQELAESRTDAAGRCTSTTRRPWSPGGGRTSWRVRRAARSTLDEGPPSRAGGGDRRRRLTGDGVGAGRPRPRRRARLRSPGPGRAHIGLTSGCIRGRRALGKESDVTRPSPETRSHGQPPARDPHQPREVPVVHAPQPHRRCRSRGDQEGHQGRPRRRRRDRRDHRRSTSASCSARRCSPTSPTTSPTTSSPTPATSRRTARSPRARRRSCSSGSTRPTRTSAGRRSASSATRSRAT